MKDALRAAVTALVWLTVCVTSATAQFVPGPTARFGHSMAYDAGRQVVVLFGGAHAVQPSSTYYADTWEWDGESWIQRNPATSPPPQAFGAMDYDSARGVCVYVGAGQTWEYDGVDWTRRNIPGPSARTDHSMSFDAQHGVMVLFGGRQFANNLYTYLSDTWTFDGTRWTQRASTGPSVRSHHDTAFDPASGTMLLFGGRRISATYPNFTYLQDTWAWDGTSWTLLSPSSAPASRNTHGLAYHAGIGRIVLTGGWTGRPNVPGEDDTWLWDGTDWTQAAPTVLPPQRAWTGKQLVYDAARNECVLFGGCTSTPQVADTWTFDGINWEPKLEFTTSPVNGHRYAVSPHQTWDDAEALAQLLGGHLATIRSSTEQNWLWSTFGPSAPVPQGLWVGLNDRGQTGTFTWASGEPVSYTAWGPNEPNNSGGNEDCVELLDIYGGGWNDRTGSLVQPGIIELRQSIDIVTTPIGTTGTPAAIRDHAIAPRAGGGALMFGGRTAAGFSFATYELDQAAWTQRFPSNNPAVRVGHALVLDTARQQNLMFGGENPIGAKLGDTWTYAAGQWTFVNPATSPAARSGHAMAFDSNSGRAILFGGTNSAGVLLGDTWAWTGSNWTQLGSSQGPSPRNGHSMCWDPGRGRVVLFGGLDASGRPTDVWEWAGSRWLLASAGGPGGNSLRPAGRTQFAMSFDPRSERVVIHGGETGASCTSDFWSWDGTEWSAHLPNGTSPGTRSGHAMFFDPAVPRLALFGGGCGTGNGADLWSLRLPILASVRAFGAGCASSSGVPLLSGRATNLPVSGQTLVLDLRGLPASAASVPFVLLGVSRTSWAGGALPIQLTSLGMPGCQLLVSPEFTGLLLNQSGQASVSLPIPNDPAILATRLFAQAGVADAAANAAGVAMSNGVRLRIGEQ